MQDNSGTESDVFFFFNLHYLYSEAAPLRTFLELLRKKNIGLDRRDTFRGLNKRVSGEGAMREERNGKLESGQCLNGKGEEG